MMNKCSLVCTNSWSDSTLISSSNDHFTVYCGSNCMFCSLGGSSPAEWQSGWSLFFSSWTHTWPLSNSLRFSSSGSVIDHSSGKRDIFGSGRWEVFKIMSTKWNRWDCMKTCLLSLWLGQQWFQRLYLWLLFQLCSSNHFWRYWMILWRTCNMKNSDLTFWWRKIALPASKALITSYFLNIKGFLRSPFYFRCFIYMAGQSLYHGHAVFFLFFIVDSKSVGTFDMDAIFLDFVGFLVKNKRDERT